MGKKTKKIIRIVVIIIVGLAVCGISGLIYMQGPKAQENLPPIVYPKGNQYANATKPSHIGSTDPNNFGFKTKIEYNAEIVDNFFRKEHISFGQPEDYTNLEGLVTFRSNNYRSSASYGLADISNIKFDKKFWSMETGELKKSALTENKGSSGWSGSGWTGQPLIVKWDEQTKQIMNLYPDKKAKKGLTEIIYATLAGEIYFIDLQDGTPTRDTIKSGYTFKGAGSLDPRGIPMMYVGGGDSKPDDNSSARVFIYSLITGEQLYEFGDDDPFALRSFHAYDSSPLVDAKTDTLIYPGENGVLYTMKLNTNYDIATAKLDITPSETVKWTYNNNRSQAATKGKIQDLDDTYWLGMEDSAVFWDGYMFIADNSGYMFCLDINTMEIIWAQDTLDDTNSTPVFEEVNQEKYLYIAPSLHWEKNQNDMGIINIYKLNAMTGDIIWQKPYDVHTVNGVSGGVQATPVVLDDVVVYPVARTPYKRNGALVALDKNTGEEKWVFNMKSYAWSSPVVVTSSTGNVYIIQCDSAGNMFLLDADSGKLLDTINLGSNIEASPAVYENTIVVGTRGKKIVGVTLT